MELERKIMPSLNLNDLYYIAIPIIELVYISKSGINNKMSYWETILYHKFDINIYIFSKKYIFRAIFYLAWLQYLDIWYKHFIFLILVIMNVKWKNKLGISKPCFNKFFFVRMKQKKCFCFVIFSFFSNLLCGSNFFFFLSN